MRLAWFSPLPPVRSGVAAYSAELLPLVRATQTVDCFVEAAGQSDGSHDAHDFLWRHQRDPYDLVVYQLGNAPCHDYMWAYLAAHPGLVVLHDARLHHARARSLLRRNAADQYRAEFRFDHPEAPPEFAEYAVEGLSGPVYYLHSMLRVVMTTARTVANHNPRVVEALRRDHPGVAVQAIRMGVAASESPLDDLARRRQVRRRLAIPDDAVVFAACGKVTAEKRIGPILRTVAALTAEGIPAYLILVGDAHEYPTLERDIAGNDRVRVAGYVDDRALDAFLAAADVCLCLRWPTALETSASWLRSLAAGRATVITDLPHLAGVPSIDPRRWRASHAGREPIAVAIDILDEDASLLLAMRRLAVDSTFRDALAHAGHQHWSRDHTLEAMAADYQRILTSAAARPDPRPSDLPAHFLEDYSGTARGIARHFGVDLDILRSG